MPPFIDMSMEEFVTLRPDISEGIPCQQRPVFWPPFDGLPNIIDDTQKKGKPLQIADGSGDGGQEKGEDKAAKGAKDGGEAPDKK